MKKFRDITIAIIGAIILPFTVGITVGKVAKKVSAGKSKPVQIICAVIAEAIAISAGYGLGLGAQKLINKLDEKDADVYENEEE